MPQVRPSAKRAAAPPRKKHKKEDKADDLSWEDSLWHTLQESLFRKAGTFACSGVIADVPFLCPQVVVEGVGQLALPLCASQAAELKAAAEQAPYGKGMDTLVDTRVRDALQVDATRVNIGGSWDPVLRRTVEQAAAAVGIEEGEWAGIQARLYKMLLYEEGGHFAPHCDTEKEAGMFATLVVQLPVAGGHEGGKLVIKHQGQQLEVDFAEGSSDSIRYSAFFADCEHQLTPITAGRRLVLAYNLVWAGVGKPPQYEVAHCNSKLVQAVAAWEREISSGRTTQDRLALPLGVEGS